LRAACAHGAERFVPGRVYESDLASIPFYLVRADRLRDPARFAGRDTRFPDMVQKRCLPMVNVAHYHDDRGALLLFGFFLCSI
jgi:hypothetical protein